MANKLWTPQTEKTLIGIAMAIKGWVGLAASFEAIPAVPEIITKPLLGELSLVTISSGLLIYGVWVLFTKY